MKETTQPADPVIDRIRAARHEISERFGHDTAALVAHYIELQKQYPDRLLHDPQPAARKG